MFKKYIYNVKNMFQIPIALQIISNFKRYFIELMHTPVD